MFKIDVNDLSWLCATEDTSKDLCLHGNVVAYIGEKKLEYEATVSATALYLLKSLTENHLIYEDNQMLPCCGFTLIADDKLENVVISGCPNGIDWSIIHEKKNVRLILDDGVQTLIPIREYKKEVLQFVDKIEQFYESSKPKKLPEDEFERNGYIAFWNEWKRRKAESIQVSGDIPV